MYLKKIRLKEIKCFEDLTLEFPHSGGNYGGWNVILGENGKGKSTILRSIALGLLNPFVGFFAIEQHDGQYTRHGADESTVSVNLLIHAREFHQTGATTTAVDRVLSFSPDGNPDVSDKTTIGGDIPDVLCYGYGPFRRLEASLASVPSGFQFPQPLSRFVSLFTDEIGLADATRGLIDLYVASIDRKHTLHRTAKRTLEAACEVIDSLLPGGVHLEGVTSEKVVFRTAAGLELADKELSDGYRSFLSLVFDLLRHLSARLGTSFPSIIERNGDHPVVNVEGVVLIDEADAHLHPSWQRELGERLRRVFPKVQFIVTTHSPFIAQEASDGGLFVLRGNDNASVSVEQPVESVRGWTASQILTSPLFGLHTTRAPETESRIRESAKLTAKERAGKLSPSESRRLKEVRHELTATLSAPGETYDEMQRQHDMAEYVDRTLNRIKSGKK